MRAHGRRLFASLEKISLSRHSHADRKGCHQLIPVFLSEAELEDYGKRISNRRGKIFQEKYRREVKGFPRVRELFQRVLADGKKSLSRHIKKLPISRTYSTPKPLPMMQNNQSRIPIFS